MKENHPESAAPVRTARVNTSNTQGWVEAINKSLAVVEFDAHGVLQTANFNFLKLMGYSLDEVQGKHHRIFCDPTYVESTEYSMFWEKLRRGEFDSAEYKRVTKSGQEVWILATYNPVVNEQGEVERVVKFATDITAPKALAVEAKGKLNAISKSQAVAEFDMQGNVLSANKNFCQVMGYSEGDLKGFAHRMFCDPKYVESIEYRKFWDKLRRGEFDSGEYKRYGCDAKEVWIQATYNPVCDAAGKPFKVVKFAIDITAQKRNALESAGRLNAIDKSQAVIDFSPDGKIVGVNENFLRALGYSSPDEIVGKHHRIFCDPAYAQTAEYRNFWDKLRRGEFDSGEYRRISRSGEDVWIQASYNPIFDADGKVYKVVKFASNITAQKFASVESKGKVDAISKSQSIVEFYVDGTVLTVNDNFTKAMGYSQDEVKGRHHRIFCEAKYVDSIEYRQFWDRLNRGEYASGEYKQMNKAGKEVWIQASFDPIYDPDGKVCKIVQFAVEVTDQKNRSVEAAGKIDAISKSAGVIEFSLDGTILDANANFLSLVGYSLEEVKGKHHRIFCDPKLVESVEYRRFWEKLNLGEFDSGEYKRLGRGGKEVWIQATYNPIRDSENRVVKVIKFAYDITAQKVRNAMFEGKVNAISKLKQLMAEFSSEGRIVSANENFLSTFGYTWAELRDRDHRELCEPAYANAPDYRFFWDKLSRGHSEEGECKRVAKNSRELWLQSSYNPILDGEGRVTMILFIGNDITAQHQKVEEFNTQVGLLEETAGGLLDAATALTQTASRMTSSAQKTSQESVTASQSLTEVASGVQTVAASTEQMVESIREISRSANESATMSKLTSSTTQETNDVVKELGSSSQQIGEVTKVISSIAQQTNLLALNATIEAARAGDAGKGFAVVANEVKELARQTAKATEDITQKIGAIQRNSSRAVEAIGGIALSVDKLNGISGTIAAAVEEQTATTNEVSRVINTASGNVRHISSSVQAVSTAADENSAAAASTLEASRKLSMLADKLKAIVGKVKSA
jgi:methyl-accepting chemotaxis protein